MHWINIKNQLPPLHRYVLIHIVNRPWEDSYDTPFFKVAMLTNGLKNKFIFEEFGMDSFTLDEVDYWCEIDRE